MCLGQEDLILINSILNQNMAKLMNEKGELLFFLIRNELNLNLEIYNYST